MNPDEASELTGDRGIGQGGEARQVIDRVRARYPEAIRKAQALRVDPLRTKYLDAAEVIDAADDVIAAKDKVIGASVRGTGDVKDKRVLLLVERPSGRHYRQVLDYKDLKKSVKAADKAVEEGDLALGDHANPAEVAAEARRIAAENAELRRQLAAQAQAEAAPADANLPADYDDLNAAELAANIRSGDYSATEVDAIQTVENDRDKPRKTVVEALDAYFAKPDDED